MKKRKKPAQGSGAVDSKADLFNVDKILARRNALADSDDDDDDGGDDADWD